MPIIEFDTKMRGYDPQQVNDAVTNFQDTINKYAQANTDLKRTLDTVNNQFTQANQDIDQLQAENKKLSERIEELEKQNDDLEAKIKNKYTSVGDDVRKLLEDTQTVYHAAERTQPTSRTRRCRRLTAFASRASPPRRRLWWTRGRSPKRT